MSPDASPEFAARLAEAWPVLTAPRLAPLAGGLLHDTWAVDDAGGDFILQRVAAAFSPDVHTNVEAVTSHLLAKGEPTFRLLRTRTGDLLWRDGGADHRLMTRLPGSSFETCPSPAAGRSAAAVMARFHSALADFDRALAELGFAYREPDISFAALEGALAGRRDHPMHAAVAALAGRIAAARAEWPPLGDLPLRVIHGDLKFSNVLFLRPAAASASAPSVAHALIDLDTVLRRPLYHDLGDAWRSWSNRVPEDVPEAELDMAMFEAVAAGYFETLSFDLTPAELVSIEQALERVALELAARFATDALEETWFGWDPTRFERSAEHQLLRATGQLALHDRAKERRPSVRRILEAAAAG
jgi:Ser/Thr protein kinase RdoA (MazF antagonist)